YQLIPQALTTALGSTGTAIASAAVSASLGNIAGQATANVMGVQKGFSFSSLATAALTAGATQGVLGPVNAPSAFGAGLAEAVNGGYAAIAARAVVGNVIGQGIGNLTGSQKGFNWSSVAISGIGAAAGAALSDNLKLNTVGTGFGADLGRAAVDAGAFALTQLAVRGGKVDWQQVATDTVTNLIQNRARSIEEEEQNKVIKKATTTVTREDSAQRMYETNLAYAEANKPIGGMTSSTSSQGGLSLATAYATDNAVVPITQPEQTITTSKDPITIKQKIAPPAQIQTSEYNGFEFDYSGVNFISTNLNSTSNYWNNVAQSGIAEGSFSQYVFGKTMGVLENVGYGIYNSISAAVRN
ncbi:MAG: hypothetical protein O9262_14425, partial [Cyclobacteriaceae bacterium]|nr:hypothetical protein [Cyclobacteriaceae bacterium]